MPPEFAPVEADLAGRTCIITGASAGIGKETARALARMGAHVVLACRSLDRGEAARREIAGDVRGTVEVMLVDVASQASVRAFASAFLDRHPMLHVLVNNAGIWARRRRESPDGVELTWATNVLGYFLVTDLLLDALKRSGDGRVVNVVSQLARDLDLSDVEFRRRPYDGVTAYAQSKQADRLLTWALARRLDGAAVTVNAMHPGMVGTELFGKAGGLGGRAASLYTRLFAKSAREGADTVVWLAASPEVHGRTGGFWIDRAERRCRFRDPVAEEPLWALCTKMTGGSPSR
jgi:NAD(P)-dependent dehydrogenase (short-subunit alcohol dehydrogenase family)